MRVFNRYLSPQHVMVFTVEMFVIFGAMTAVASLSQSSPEAAVNLWKVGLVTGLCLLCLYYNECYDLTVVRTERELTIRCLQSVGAASILLALLYLVAPSLVVADGAFLAATIPLLLAILAWRLLFNRLVTLGPLEERVLIVGTGPGSRLVAGEILAQRDFPYHIVGFIDEDQRRVGQPLMNPGIVGTPADIERLVSTHGVDRIIVGLHDRRGKLPVAELLRAKIRGVCVEDVNTVFERLTGKLLVEELRPSWLIFSDGFRASRLTRFTKRTFDIVLAAVGLVLAAPLMLLTAIAVWLESGSPVLYRQERVGEHGRPFTLMKFRSMRHDAEQGTPIWARDGDARVTQVGRFIRQTRLDELPQLWTVLQGDMSFVGPRPERPFFVAQLASQISFYEQRHSVKPGITGWAQIKYRYGASIEDALEKLQYDLYYVKHLSLTLDLTILFDTVRVVLFAKGAR
jgi:sugar transferase (PEP-CTERM system associated)